MIVTIETYYNKGKNSSWYRKGIDGHDIPLDKYTRIDRDVDGVSIRKIDNGIIDNVRHEVIVKLTKADIAYIKEFF
jgi:hypothetical protein